MKKLIFALILAGCVSETNKTFAQDRDPMAARHEYMMSTPMHTMMREWTGRWREEIRTFEESPQRPPSIGQGLCEMKMVLGDRFLSVTHRGDAYRIFYETDILIGYDNARKVFVCNWADTYGTGLTTMEGSIDDKKQTITFNGTYTDPATAQRVAIRQVWKIVDKTHQTLEVYVMGKEKEYKSMEIKMTKLP